MAEAALSQPREMMSGEDDGQYLTFILSGETYGINILHIREIIDYGDLTPVPMMPAFITGVINLRGSVVPVIDLAVRFGGTLTEVGKRTSIVILEIDSDDAKLEIGVVVDAVNEVLDIPAAEIEPAPSFGTSLRTDFIAGMGKIAGRFLVLLDIGNVLSVDELSAVRSTQDDLNGTPQS